MIQLELIFPEEVETWRDVEGYVGLYQISNRGRVKRLVGKYCKEERELKHGKDRYGYLYVVLSKDGKTKQTKVHRLVAMAFIPNPYGLPQVNHRDENKENNRVENLEWCGVEYNINYGTRTERAAKARTGIYNTKCSKHVYQYTLDGMFIREWSSVREVERQTGWSHGNISACCRSFRYKSVHNYKWSYVRL